MASNFWKVVWALTPPGAIVNIIKRSIEAERQQNGEVYGVVLGSVPTENGDNLNFERVDDWRNPIAYRAIIRPAKNRRK